MNPAKGVFVTGTDTDVGKTVVSALILSVMRKNEAVKYWKPVETGVEKANDTNSVERLANCDPKELHAKGIRLERPLSPHLSARLEGIGIGIEEVLGNGPLEAGDEFWVVEGAGGVMVPLNDHELMIDLIVRLGLPAVVVSRTGLGTINHSLLTIESIRSRGGTVAGVVMNGVPNSENSSAIAEFGKVRILTEVPVLDPLSPETVAELATVTKFDFR